VPVGGFREEPERAPAAAFAEQDRSFHGRPLHRLCHFSSPRRICEAGTLHIRRCGVRKGNASPPPASNNIMGCDRGTRLSVLWIHLHPVQPRSHARPERCLRLIEAIGHAAVGAVRRAMR